MEKRSGDDHDQYFALLELEEESPSNSSSSSIGQDSSDDTGEEEEASSSTSSNSSSNSSLSIGLGPLYELSELMSQLPMKRGLSKYYDGRSQSYTTLLASVKSVEDLQKKKEMFISISSRKRLKLCKSYGGGLDKSSAISPRAVISKKGPGSGGGSNSRGGLSSSSSTSLPGRRSSLALATSRPPVPLIKTQLLTN